MHKAAQHGRPTSLVDVGERSTRNKTHVQTRVRTHRHIRCANESYVGSGQDSQLVPSLDGHRERDVVWPGWYGGYRSRSVAAFDCETRSAFVITNKLSRY